MNLSQKGLDLIKRFEGIRLIAYKVVPTEKHFTIGYGHYGADVKQAMRITEERAEELLKQDVASFVNGVNACLKVKVNQNQFDALVSFAYNVGLGALIKSDLLQYLNQGDYKKASNEFPRWNKSGGQVLQGLVNRRKAEQTLFNHVTDLPYKVIIPNTAFWQAKALVIEFEERGFQCEGVALKVYGVNEQPKEKDPYHFVVYCEHERAKDLVIEFKHRGYDRVYGEEIK